MRKAKKFILGVFYLFIVTGISMLHAGAAFAEPVHSGPQFIDGYYADPDVQNYNGTYWVFPTRPKQETDPGGYVCKTIDIFSSTDLVNWTKYPSVISPDNVKWIQKALFAPNGINRNGKYYIYFSANAINGDGQLGGIGVAVADNPQGPYTDAIGAPLINVVRNNAGPMDQDVFIDDDGQAYMVYGSWGDCNVVKLNDDMISLGTWPDGTVYKKITPNKTGERDDYFEGPKMFKRNGIYYMTYSSGVWVDYTYTVCYATSDSITGPFVKQGVMLQSDDTTAYGPGHNGIVKSPSNEWYIFYHKRYLNDPAWDHRILAFDKFDFNADNSIKPVRMAVEDNFSDRNTTGWTTYGGTWTLSDGQYTVASNPGAKSMLDTNFSNMIYEADVTAGSTGNAGLIFRVTNPGTGTDAYTGYYAAIDVPNQRVMLGKANNNWTSITTVPMSLTANTKYHLKIEAQDSSIMVYVGDMTTPKIKVTDSSYVGGAVGVRTYNSAAKFDNITVTKTAIRLENKQFSKLLQGTETPDGTGTGFNVRAVNTNMTGLWTQWNLTAVSGGQYFRIENQNSGRWLQCADMNTPDATNGLPDPVLDADTLAVRAVGRNNTGDYTQWIKVDAGEGYFYLKNKATGYYIQVTNLSDIDTGSGDGGLQIRAVPSSKNGDWTKFRSIKA